MGTRVANLFILYEVKKLSDGRDGDETPVFRGEYPLKVWNNKQTKGLWMEDGDFLVLDKTYQPKRRN